MPNQILRFLLPLFQNARDLAPIVLVIGFFQLVVVREPVPDLADKAIGLGFVLLGLTLFLSGLAISLFPLGENLSEEFAQRGNLWLLLSFAFAIGFGSTVAEPALIEVARQAATAMASAGDESTVVRIALTLRLASSAAVGLSVVLSCIRIIKGWPALVPVLAVYAVAFFVVLFRPTPTAGIAFDAGAAATSAINVPLIAALGIGLATALEGRSPLADGFGAVALASAMPMIILLLGLSLFG